MNLLIIPIVLLILAVPMVIWVMSLRRVVPTNQVHIVQRSKVTRSYGSDTSDNVGNTYYEWPSWMPIIGITKIVLPVSVFDLDLVAYEAYDRMRLPFVVDVKSFFRIDNSNMAASRVESFNELHEQLLGIVQGAVRSILAQSELEEIMSERGEYGKRFTAEVSEQLAEWGVNTVKPLELMDIRDSRDSRVIANIMAKQESAIDRESRVEVAENRRLAEEAEIESVRAVNIKQVDATREVDVRSAEAHQQVGVAKEQAQQVILEQARETTFKDMAVKRVKDVETASIKKASDIVNAEAERDVMINIAQGELEAKEREAAGIKLVGEAKAKAELDMQMATSVSPQVELAREIGANDGYQRYLISVKKIEAVQAVGMEQARALEKADVKIIANASGANNGLENAASIFNSETGFNIGSVLEGLAATDVGKTVVEKVTKSGK